MFEYTVQAASGSPAAATRSRSSGTGSSCACGTTASEAYPPPLSSAHTRSPTAQSVTPVPRARTVPDTSSPSTSDAPGGGG